MRRILGQALLPITALVLLLGNVPVHSAPTGYTTATKLPSGFEALVPKGYEITSSQISKSGNQAGVSFAALKRHKGGHSNFDSEYRLNLDLRVTASQIIKMQGPIYQSQLEKDLEVKRKSYANQGEPVVVTKYPWGYGITQRQVHPYVGEGTGRDEIDYMCEYLGLILDDTSVKKFELLAGEVDSSDEGNQWAKKVVEKIAKTTLANIGD